MFRHGILKLKAELRFHVQHLFNVEQVGTPLENHQQHTSEPPELWCKQLPFTQILHAIV